MFERTQNLQIELLTAVVVFAVKIAIRELPTRTFFGSDAPYGDPLVSRTLVERSTPPGELRDRVLGGNLEELLRRIQPDGTDGGRCEISHRRCA